MNSKKWFIKDSVNACLGPYRQVKLHMLLDEYSYFEQINSEMLLVFRASIIVNSDRVFVLKVEQLGHKPRIHTTPDRWETTGLLFSVLMMLMYTRKFLKNHKAQTLYLRDVNGFFEELDSHEIELAMMADSIEEIVNGVQG